MKKAKTKAKRTPNKRTVAKKAKERAPRPKPAIRSEAFAQAVEDAKLYIKDPERLRELFDEAVKKVASIPREPFRETWAYFQAMLRLLRAYYRGEYREAPPAAMLSIIAAITYLVNPFDLIPDEVPFLGFVDDAAVIVFAVRKTRGTLDDFMFWEVVRL